MSRYSLIIAGGSGTRLWPLSRLALPKQLLKLIPDESGGRRSLLELADARLDGVVDASRRYICAAESQRRPIVDAIPSVDDDRFLGEPMGRDTVNAIALGAAVIAKRDPNAVFAVLTADHLIDPQEEFARAMDLGFRLVEENSARLVTFSIKAEFAATGYGWIRQDQPIASHDGAFEVSRYVEKPALPDATQFLADSAFRWNSGMFVFSAKGFLDALRLRLPKSLDGIMRIADAWDTPQRGAVLDEIYPTLEKISVDYTVLKTSAGDPRTPVCTVPMHVKWRDVGSWPSLGEALGERLGTDAHGNRTVGSVHLHETSDSVVFNDGDDHLVAVVGLKNVIVVHTADATLVCAGEAKAAEAVKGVATAVPERLR